jgi:alanine-glyoxylate transaminase/serine-glyoxylate transaminase/serine-pyruvate transaminase
MRAMSAPVLSHLDPEMVQILDDLRARLSRVFGAAEGAFSLAISGTGTAGMEAAVANAVTPGARALVVINGYFGERLSEMLSRYGAKVTRVESEWGRACDPAAVERHLSSGADIVAIVHGETSTGVVNPVEDVVRVARSVGALTIVDAVTSFGAVPLRTAAAGIDICYSCTQKGLGAPSGLAPISFSPEALKRRADARSFYLDLRLLEDYWIRRRYHHTISAPLVFALREALTAIEEEGLEKRWERHRRTHLALVAGLDVMGLGLLPPANERLWSLNTVRVPEGVDEAAVRRRLLSEFDIEIGAGLGPLAGRIWRVGLMGSGSTLANVVLFLGALHQVLGAAGYKVPSSTSAIAAAESAGS